MRNHLWLRIGLFVVVVILLLAGGLYLTSKLPSSTVSTVAPAPTAVAAKPAAAAKKLSMPATARKQETKTVVEGKKTQATVTSSAATTTTASGETAPVCSGQCQSTAVIVKSRGVEAPAPPDCAKGSQCQITNVIVNSPASPLAMSTPPAPATTLPPPVAAPRPSATAQFEIVVSLVSWSEALRPAVANGRVEGGIIGPAMNAGQAVRFESEVDLDVVKSDGRVMSLRTKLGQRGALAVNEAVIAMPRTEAAAFGISNIVPKSGGFILPQHSRFDQIADSVARGRRGIIFFLVAAPPPAAVRSMPPPPPPPAVMPPQS